MFDLSWGGVRGMVEMVSRVLGGLHYRKSVVQGRMFDLSWGVCKTNGGNGVQGGCTGFSWGVFTTEKVMPRVGCLICHVWWKWCPG